MRFIFYFYFLCIRPKYHPSGALHKVIYCIVFLNTIYMYARMYLYMYVNNLMVRNVQVKLLLFYTNLLFKKKNKKKKKKKKLFVAFF